VFFPRKKYILFFFCCVFAAHFTFAQTDSATIIPTVYDSFAGMPFNKKRLAVVLSSEAVLYGGSLVGLNELWYKDYPRSSFHFFDDNDEWMQMDKIGHLTTSYYIGRVGIGFMNWTGMKRKKAIWFGGMLGSLYQTTIEVLDGYSSEWGFSAGDFAANTAGSLLCVGQQLAWDEQRIVLKFSFMQSKYSRFRPDVLGNTLTENILKDYNGQTYWLSVNPSSFMSSGTKFPKWLNIAVGYGADGMTGGSFNPPYIDANGSQVYNERYRQFYLSLDVDLTRIKTRSKVLKTIFYAVGYLKIPAPALEFNKFSVKGNLLGF
jgi:uncharacterized protein YfiM (DUF2279 family)